MFFCFTLILFSFSLLSLSCSCPNPIDASFFLWLRSWGGLFWFNYFPLLRVMAWTYSCVISIKEKLERSTGLRQVGECVSKLWGFPVNKKGLYSDYIFFVQYRYFRIDQNCGSNGINEKGRMRLLFQSTECNNSISSWYQNNQCFVPRKHLGGCWVFDNRKSI